MQISLSALPRDALSYLLHYNHVRHLLCCGVSGAGPIASQNEIVLMLQIRDCEIPINTALREVPTTS
jgi:hypothetical protein